MISIFFIKRLFTDFFLIAYIVFVMVIAGIILGYIPKMSIFVADTNSMAPTIKRGDMIFVRRYSEYDIGDIISFEVYKSITTHRIIQKDIASHYHTKGDGNTLKDPFSVTKGNIIGKVDYVLPYLGYLTILIQSCMSAAMSLFNAFYQAVSHIV